MNKLLSGKVREIYAVDDQALVIVTTDRISAYDVVLGSQVPGKGVALNLISLHWFDQCASIVQTTSSARIWTRCPRPFAKNPSTTPAARCW